MGGKKPLRRPLWPPTRATASNYYPLGLDGAGGAAKPLLRAPKKPAPLHGRLPAFSGAVDAFERARKCFLEWRYFFSIILSEFLKNRVALQCVSVIPIPDTASAVIWRFWAELIPLLSVIAITLIFWLADQKKIRLHLTGKPVYNIILGGVTGTIWLGASVGILSILGVVQIEGKNQIAMLWLWLLAAFLNTVMQEMLVRGYLYQMIKSNGSIAAAIIVSTGLFTFAHGGAFEAGILPVLNVITMSLFMTAVLEYTGSLIAPIVIHFLWNGVGAIILGGVSLAEDYPHLFDMTIHGNPILSGGSCKIEGSIIVLFMNLAFLIGFVAAKKRKDRNR